MLFYIIFGIIMSLIGGALIWMTLDNQKKWSDSLVFILSGIVFGFILLYSRNYFELWGINTINFYLATLAYLTTYYCFYREFKSDHKNINFGFWQYIAFMAKNAPVLIKDASAEDALKTISRDIFYSDQMKEITKIWYEDKPEPDAFGGWLSFVWNFLFFAGMTGYVASLASFEEFFYSIFVNQEIRLLFWGIIAIVIGVFIKAFIDSRK